MVWIVKPERIVIPKSGISREESAVSPPPPAATRFLADKPGFGMTRRTL